MDVRRQTEEEKARIDGEQERLTEVSNLLSQKIENDRNAITLEDILFMNQTRAASPYQPLRESKQFLPDEKHRHILQVKGTKKRLPEAILARKETLKEENYMFGGLFPEIHRAWITIDKTLYLWNYLDGSQYEVYDNLDHIILTAALVKPRPGVFVDRTHWLLVLTTPLEIVVLALLFDPPVDIDGAPIPAKSKLILQPTPVCVSSDNVVMLRVVGSPDGRIFMGGGDGLVYELEYGVESGWDGLARKSRKKACKPILSNFGFALGKAGKFIGAGWIVDHFMSDDGPIKCMVVDSSRGHHHEVYGRLGLMYVLMDPPRGGKGSVIEAYAIRSDRIVCFWRLDQKKLQAMLRDYSGAKYLEEDTLATINVVPRHGNTARDQGMQYENSKVHLVAVTVNGARIYFTADYTQEAKEDGHYFSGEPDNLRVCHVTPPMGEIRNLLDKQLERGYSLEDEIKIDSTLPQRSLLTGNLTVLHSTDDAVRSESSGDSTPILIAIGRDYAKYSAVASHIPQMAAATRSPEAEGYKETVQVIQVERDIAGIPIRVLAMAESPYPYGSNIFNGYCSTMTEDELVTQQDVWPREILVLQEDGLQPYLKLRPLEWMAIYLQFPQWAQFREEMFTEYGQEEGCAMCFALATGDFSFLPRESVLQSINREKVHDHAIEVLSTAESIMRPEPHKFTTGSDAGQYDCLGAAVPMLTKRNSYRFEGLVKFTARVLEPVWDHPITEVNQTLEKNAPFTLGEDNPRPDPPALQELRLRSRDQWNALVVSIDALIQVIERLYPASDLTPSLSQAWPQRDMDAIVGFMREYNQSTIDKDREAMHAETQLVFGLYQMLKISREAAKLFRILCQLDISNDAFFSEAPAGQALRFPMIVGRLYTNEQKAISELKFKDLVVKRETRYAGKPMNRLLHILVEAARDNRHEQFGAKLIRDCPSFFGEPDQSRLKAKTILDEAKKKKADNPQGYEWKTKVDDAMQEYRKVMFYVIPGETGKLLAELGRYADAIEISLLKMLHVLQPKEKEELIEQTIKYLENVWLRKFSSGPFKYVQPPMSPEEVDEQWRHCLDNALYFGGVQHLRDPLFYYRLFEAFCGFGGGDTGKAHLVALARSHAHLVDPHLYQFLEEYHVEDLYRAYEQAGRFEEAAYQLKYLAEETLDARKARYDKLKGLNMKDATDAQPSDLLEQRVRWLSQAILCLQGTGGVQAHGTTRSTADLLQILHDTREVLEVQWRLKQEVLQIPSLPQEARDNIEFGVLTNTEMWFLLDDTSYSQQPQQPMWQRHHLYGLCLCVLSLSDERMNERYVEKVEFMWKCIIEDAYNRDGREGIQNQVEKWSREFCPLSSIRDEDGAVFPLRCVVDRMEHFSHATISMGLDPTDLQSIGWVVNLLHLKVKIPHMALFNRYKLLLSDPTWQPRQDQQKRQVHLLKAIAYLLRSWLASQREDDVCDLRMAQIDFEEFQIKLVANAPYMTQMERENLQRAFQDSMERRRHLSW